MAVGEYLSIPSEEEAGQQTTGIEGHGVLAEHAKAEADAGEVEVEGLSRLLKSGQPIGHRRPAKYIQEVRLEKKMHPEPGACHEGHPGHDKCEPTAGQMEH